MSEYFIRLGMTDELRRKIEDWRTENVDDKSGKVPSFSKAVRELIDGGLSA